MVEPPLANYGGSFCVNCLQRPTHRPHRPGLSDQRFRQAPVMSVVTGGGMPKSILWPMRRTLSSSHSANRPRGGNLHRTSVLAIATLLIPAVVGAQADTSSDVDSIGPVFRGTIDSVAAVAGHGSLRDRQLTRGTLRELRVNVGFGLGFPQEAARIWEDSKGAHGWLGLWWPGTQLHYSIPDGSKEDYSKARKDFAEWVALVREDARKSGCKAFHKRPAFETCTLPSKRVDWAAVLQHLDSLGIARLSQQRADRLGFDGVTTIVEYRDAGGYHAYSYHNPRVEAEDPNERAAARIMESIEAIYRRVESR